MDKTNPKQMFTEQIATIIEQYTMPCSNAEISQFIADMNDTHVTSELIHEPRIFKCMGWKRINPKSGSVRVVFHFTDYKGLHKLKNNLGNIQISCLNKNDIDNFNNNNYEILVKLKGLVNKRFSGDIGSMVDTNGNRWYDPSFASNAYRNVNYDELIVVPLEIISYRKL